MKTRLPAGLPPEFQRLAQVPTVVHVGTSAGIQDTLVYDMVPQQAVASTWRGASAAWGRQRDMGPNSLVDGAKRLDVESLASSVPPKTAAGPVQTPKEVWQTAARLRGSPV